MEPREFQPEPYDFEAAERCRVSLLRILAMLVSMAGFVPGGGAATLKRRVYTHILRLLHPAEVGVRRLVVFAAWKLEVTLAPSRPRDGKMRSVKTEKAGDTEDRIPAFPLIDPPLRHDRRPWKRRTHVGPYIYDPGYTERPVFMPAPLPMPEDDLDATPLRRRLISVQRALEDIPAQALRLARWTARRARSDRPGPLSPMRTGRPPAHRAKPLYEVDLIYEHCQSLARLTVTCPYRIPYRDTS